MLEDVHQPEQLVLLNWVSKGHSYAIQRYDGSDYTDKWGHDIRTSFSIPDLSSHPGAQYHVF